MPHEIQGQLIAGEHRFALVVSRTNDFITTRLLEGALDALQRHGCDPGNLTVVRVPGAFELPLAAKMCAVSGRYHAVVCLGCLIRGRTPHFEFIAAEAAKGVAQVALETELPVSFGVITADTLEQAVERAGSKSGNKGADAALAAVEMINVLNQIAEKKSPGPRSDS